MKSLLAATLFLLAGISAKANDKKSTLVDSAPIRAAIHSFELSHDQSKLFLKWDISLNQDADRIEVEKSTDNQNFKMAALVWTSEKNATEHYAFYEKESKKIVYYRLKLVAKDGHITYSNIITTGK